MALEIAYLSKAWETRGYRPKPGIDRPGLEFFDSIYKASEVEPVEGDEASAAREQWFLDIWVYQAATGGGWYGSVHHFPIVSGWGDDDLFEAAYAFSHGKLRDPFGKIAAVDMATRQWLLEVFEQNARQRAKDIAQYQYVEVSS